LPHYGIELPKAAKSVLTYADRVFEREGFQLSLTEGERELRL
jgi:RNA polymerase-associated protein